MPYVAHGCPKLPPFHRRQNDGSSLDWAQSCPPPTRRPPMPLCANESEVHPASAQSADTLAAALSTLILTSVGRFVTGQGSHNRVGANKVAHRVPGARYQCNAGFQ